MYYFRCIRKITLNSKHIEFSVTMVPEAGVEPAPCRQDRILSPARLPIPSFRQILNYALTARTVAQPGSFTKAIVLYIIQSKISRVFLIYLLVSRKILYSSIGNGFLILRASCTSKFTSSPFCIPQTLLL